MSLNTVFAWADTDIVSSPYAAVGGKKHENINVIVIRKDKAFLFSVFISFHLSVMIADFINFQ
jgi:hypothetical protein